MITKKCKICGNEFQANNNKAIYCTGKCRSQAFRNKLKRFYTAEEVVSAKYDSIIKSHEWKILEYVRILKIRDEELENKNKLINQLQKQLLDYAFKNNELQFNCTMKDNEIEVLKNEIINSKRKKSFEFM